MGNNRKEFINKYWFVSVLSTCNTNLMPSVVIAQAILESSDGNSILATKYNNFFGIKGKGVILNTPKDPTPKSSFKVYPSPFFSFWDHRKLLTSAKRYKEVLAGKDYIEQCTALSYSGYAGINPNYGKVLISLIKQNDLQKYDNKFRFYLIAFGGLFVVLALFAYRALYRSLWKKIK